MNEFWKDSPELDARLDRVLELMDGSLRSPDFPLADAVAGIARANGKLLRPALIIIGSRFGTRGAQVDEARIDALAAAVELLHLATLVHDDIIDEAALRRGKPALHTRFGTKEAVLAGDWLFSRSFRLAAESAGPANAQALARLIGAICAAEIDQDLGKWRYSSSVRRYYRTIAGKTAALFSLALYAGAAECKAKESDAQSLRRAGYDIGMAFQVIDDILDCESSEDAMRKPVGADLREGLCTLPLVLALRAEDESLRAELGLLRGAGASDALVASILGRIARLGGIRGSRDAARRFTERARSEIARLPACSSRDDLSGIAEKLLKRGS